MNGDNVPRETFRRPCGRIEPAIAELCPRIIGCHTKTIGDRETIQALSMCNLAHICFQLCESTMTVAFKRMVARNPSPSLGNQTLAMAGEGPL
jgi:hypothetical protein